MNKVNKRPSLALLIELATRDLWHDRKVSLCIVAALVAVIAPLLLLFGLKYGVVSQLNQQLLNDPRTLEVRMLGNYDLNPAWFERLRTETAAAFVMPLTRSLNTSADLMRDSQHFVANAEVIPTSSGDPLLAELAAPKALEQVLLSASAASKMGVNTGDTVRLLVLRKLDGSSQRGELNVSVAGVLPHSAFTRPAVLVQLGLLVAMEDFRDGFAVPLLGFSDGQTAPERSRFARARIYAKGLDDVTPIAQWLESEHIESSTQAAEIESVKAISQVLGLIFAVIAWTALIGCAASLVGAFLANIDRKRKDLALLRLLGFQRSAAALYIVSQAVVLTLIAFVLGYGTYLIGSTVFNQALGSHLADNGFVCTLEPVHIGLALVGALSLSILVAVIGGLRAIHIQPAESLRGL